MTISSPLIDVASLPDVSTTAGKIADLKARRIDAASPVGRAAQKKVRDNGRLTARDRLDYLLDPHSFVEIDQLARHRTYDFGMRSKRPATDGIITGWGTIDGREVCVFSQDGTVFGGALGEVYGEKMCKLMELAVTTGRPLIGLYEGAGARIQDGAVSLDLIAQTFYHNINASGVVPQISVIMGSCAGGNAYSPALTDFVVMVDKTSKMFVTGPDVIKTVTSEDISQEELGGASVHMCQAGNSHYTASSDEDLTWVAHAMVGTYGYELLDGLPSAKEYDYCVWKGVDPELHPYGACFHDIEEKLSTGLIEWLRCQHTDTVIVGGLATDYCVKTTVLQLLKGGNWQVIVNEAACRGIAPETIETAWQEMRSAGAMILKNAEEIKKYINNQ